MTVTEFALNVIRQIDARTELLMVAAYIDRLAWVAKEEETCSQT